MASSQRVLVWCADGNPLAGASYADRIVARFQQVTTMDVEVAMLAEGPLTDAQLGAGYHLLTGGSTPADSRQSWVAATRSQLREVLDGPSRVVGICLGSQLLATVLGASCAPGPNGLEVGLGEIGSVSSRDTFVAAQFHYHDIDPAILDVPEVVWRFTSEHTRIQGFDHADRHRALQFHPEFTPGEARELVERHPELLAEHGVSAEQVHARTDRLADAWAPSTFDHLVVDFLLGASDDHDTSAG